MSATYPRTRPEQALADSGLTPRAPEVAMQDAVGTIVAFMGVELADDGAHAGVQHPAASGNRGYGISLAAVAIGASVPVVTSGLAKGTLGATLTAPTELVLELTTGKLIAPTSPGDAIFADLLEDGGEDDVVFVHVRGQGGGLAAEGVNVTLAAASAAANVCEVTITVKDKAGTALAEVFNLDVWLSDAATGAGITGTTASGTVTNKTASGIVLDTYTAKKSLRMQTLATGIVILEITDSAKTAFYVCVQNPATGETVVGTVLATGDYGA